MRKFIFLPIAAGILLLIMLVPQETIAQFGNATQIWSRNIASTPPSDGQVLTYSASNKRWQPGAVSGQTGCVPAGSAGQILTDSGSSTCSPNAPWTITSNTMAATAAGILDLHLAATSAFKVPGGFATGLLHVTTSTGATAGGLLVNADITNGTIAAAKLIGTDIATVGTVTAGTWNATTIAIAAGGSGATTQTAAFDNLAPTATVPGSIIYWNGTHWVKFDGNASGTNCFTEDASGVPSWATCGSGGGSPGGSNTQLQYNNSGSFGGAAGWLITNTGQTLTGGASSILDVSAGKLTLPSAVASTCLSLATVSNVSSLSVTATCPGYATTTTGGNTFGTLNVFTPDNTNASLGLAAHAIESAIASGYFNYDTSGHMGWFNNTNMVYIPEIVGSGRNAPTVPTSGKCVEWGSNYSLVVAASNAACGAGAGGNINTVTFSATPTFDLSLGTTQKITLTGNVTSETISNQVAGHETIMMICQDGTGSRTFAWDSAFKSHMTIDGTASTCSLQKFVSDGTNLYAAGPGVVGQ